MHLLDLSPLSDAVRALELDPQCTAHFIDMRHHSCMVPTADGCCLSLCYFQMDEQSMQVHLFKLYFYLSKGLVLTYVVELMPELQGRAVVGSHHTSSRSSSSRLASSHLQLLEDHFSPIDAVCNAVFDIYQYLSHSPTQPVASPSTMLTASTRDSALPPTSSRTNSPAKPKSASFRKASSGNTASLSHSEANGLNSLSAKALLSL